MAIQRANYTYESLSVPSAYLRVSSVQMDIAAQAADVTYTIYATKAVRESGGAPLTTGNCYSTGADLATIFGGAIPAGETGSVPTNAADALWATAYAALKQDPQSTSLLAGSTAA